jgi:hypothetical protein
VDTGVGKGCCLLSKVGRFEELFEIRSNPSPVCRVEAENGGAKGLEVDVEFVNFCCAVGGRGGLELEAEVDFTGRRGAAGSEGGRGSEVGTEFDNSRGAVACGGGRELGGKVEFADRRDTVGSGGGWEFEVRAEEVEAELKVEFVNGLNPVVETSGGWEVEAEAEVEVVSGGFVEEVMGVEVEVEVEAGPIWLVRWVTRVGLESKLGVEDATEVGTEGGTWLSESEAAGSCGAVGGDRLMVFSSQPRCSPKLLRVMRSN